MKNSKLIIVSAIFVGMIFFSCSDKKSEQSTVDLKTSNSKEELIKRGEYLVTIIGCDHCHTPKKMTPTGPVPDMDRWLMGYPNGDELPEIEKSKTTPSKWLLFNGDLTAGVGPWGVSFAANLTPDETGIGNWTFENFKRAMTEGKYKGLENSRPIMPPMPWQSYKEMKENDLKAIFEYLKSIKPIKNDVPSYIPPTNMGL